MSSSNPNTDQQEQLYRWRKVFEKDKKNLPELGKLITWNNSGWIVQGTLGMKDNREHIRWHNNEGGCYLYIMPEIEWLEPYTP